ncbi:hypothetical protein EDD17DRAFT_1675642 [Pisolithus thermaeus]|nr:hypothetical protein EDD17DRAFT_1675642 [Pisolithus thermaeus]
MVKYISASELANVIQSDKKPWKDYLVVDVRDEDWIGGNITGSHNAPSQSFLNEVDKLMKDTKDIPMLVFHCRYSQERWEMVIYVVPCDSDCYNIYQRTKGRQSE